MTLYGTTKGIPSLCQDHDIIRRTTYYASPQDHLLPALPKLSSKQPPKQPENIPPTMVHIDSDCAAGDHGCISFSLFFPLLLAAIILTIFVGVFFFLRYKKHRRPGNDIEDNIGNEHVEYNVNNIQLKDFTQLPPLPKTHSTSRETLLPGQAYSTDKSIPAPLYGCNLFNTPRGTNRAPRSSADLWKQRGYDFSAPPPPAAGPSTFPTPAPQQTVREEGEDIATFRRSLDEAFGTPTDDPFASPRDPFAASRSNPYEYPKQPNSTPEGMGPQGGMSISTPVRKALQRSFGTPIHESLASPQVYTAGARTLTPTPSFPPPRANPYETETPALRANTQHPRHATVEDDTDLDPPKPQETTSFESRRSRFTEHLTSPVKEMPHSSDEKWDEVVLSPPRGSMQSDAGSESRRSFQSSLSDRLPASWGKVLRSSRFG